MFYVHGSKSLAISHPFWNIYSNLLQNFLEFVWHVIAWHGKFDLFTTIHDIAFALISIYSSGTESIEEVFARQESKDNNNSVDSLCCDDDIEMTSAENNNRYLFYILLSLFTVFFSCDISCKFFFEVRNNLPSSIFIHKTQYIIIYLYRNTVHTKCALCALFVGTFPHKQIVTCPKSVMWCLNCLVRIVVYTCTLYNG